MKFRSLSFLLVFFATFLRSLGAEASTSLPDGLYAEFSTPRGTFTVQLDFERVPMTVASFVGLAEGSIEPRQGKPFFNGLTWYRVVPGFVIQSGDPEHARNADKEDAGHPYTFPDEFVPGLRHSEAGVLSMANAGPDTNSCEFFVTLADCTRLNYLHSVFGHTVRGLDVLPQIQAGDACTIHIVRRGATAQAFKADPATFQALTATAPKYTGSPLPGPTAHFFDPDGVLPVEPPRAKYFNFKLANFERVNGVKLVGRVFAKSPTEAEDAVPGAFMRGLAQKLGVDRSGVLVAYFADEKDWRVWLGDDLVPRFLGRPVRDGDLKDGGALHDAKMALIDGAEAKGDAAFAAQQHALPADAPPLHPGQQAKLQADALLDALIFRFEKTPVR